MKCMTPKEIHEDVVKTLAEDSPFQASVNIWSVVVESTEDDSRSATPKTKNTAEQLDAIHRVVLDGRRLAAQWIAKSRGITYWFGAYCF